MITGEKQESSNDNADISFPDITNDGCEPEDKCCCVIPIRTGLIIVSVFTILFYLVFPVYMITTFAILYFNDDATNLVSTGIIDIAITAIVTVPGFISSWWMYVWIRLDNMDSRNKLVLAIIITGIQPVAYTLIKII